MRSWDRDRQKAFWINAYNAFVLQTVVSQYPIRGRAPITLRTASVRFPVRLRRRLTWRRERALTLDQIETTVLAEFKDPRVFVALGRGAVGSGRLRSEAFGAKMVDRQLEQSKAQFATSPQIRQG